MTYAHDLFLDPDFDRSAFTAAVDDIRTLFRRTELPVVGLSGRPGTLPMIEDDVIAFNGINHDCNCDPQAPDYHDLFPCWPSTRCSPVNPRNDGNDWGAGFWMDLRSESAHTSQLWWGKLWFEFATRRRAYDQAVMLVLVALKHHLGGQAEIHSKGIWSMWQYPNDFLFAWGPGWSRTSSVVSMYEHVFPERAPVQNILTREGNGAG